MHKFIAHRGNNSNSCENNLNGLLSVLNYDYISGIEVDIRETLDHKLILSHNSFLKNNTNIYFINRSNLKDLKQHTYKINGKEFYVHTLQELLSKIQHNKIILLDIKNNINIDLLYKILKKYNYLNIYICSFNYDLILQIKKKYPKLYVGIIIGYNMNRKKDIKMLDFISIHYNYIDDYDTTYYNCFIWTVNKDNILNKIDKNIGIITDNSYKLKEH